VHPSARILQDTRPKLLKIKQLNVFKNGAFFRRFMGGNALAEKGSDWAKLRRCLSLTYGTLIALAASNRL